MNHVLKIKYLVLFILLNPALDVLGQSHRIQLDWQNVTSAKDGQGQIGSDPWFEGAYESTADPKLPEFGVALPVGSDIVGAEVSLRNPRFEKIERLDWMTDELIPTDIALRTELVTMRKKKAVYVRFETLVRRGNGTIERLVEGELWVDSHKGSGTRTAIDFAEHSKLSSGTWFRVNIPADGVYRMDRAFFQAMGVDVDAIDPSTINVYGNDTGLLSYQNVDYDSDDLQLKSIRFDGEADGSFDSGDQILFYAKGPQRWDYNTTAEQFEHTKHLYMNVAFCFIGIGVDPPQRIGTQPAVVGSPTHFVSTFDDYSFHESDLENVIKSGRQLVGEKFGLSQTLSFGGSAFNFEHIDLGTPVKIRMRGVASTYGSGSSSSIAFSSQGHSETMNIPGDGNQYNITNERVQLLEFLPSNGDLSVSAVFTPGGSDARGWVDYITMNVRRNLLRTSSQLKFRDVQSVGAGNIAQYTIGDMTDGQSLWDVTDPQSVESVPFTLSASNVTFLSEVDNLREFVLFNNSNVLVPNSPVSVANQDLHASEQYDMVIVTAVPFKGTAEKVADIHRQEGLSVVVLEPQTIYNEFGCGMTDITAIKMYLKMLYDRAGSDIEAFPDYLLLIGDGNNIQNSIDPSSSIYLPSYQSLESGSLTGSYISDDYYGLLDDDESEGGGAVDVGIGRFPLRDQSDADAVYGKIVRYISENTGVVGGVCNASAESAYGDWRNKILLIGDDEDSNSHMSQANSLGTVLSQVDEDYIINRVFLDAYLQDITPGGARYPQAAEEIKRSIEGGVFIASYTGHGGEVGWAAERVLDVPTIQGFTNSNRLPLLLTATCEFSRYDDPDRTSAGEFTLLNPNGGVIALMSTTRLVYSGPNFTLSKNFFDVVLRKDATMYTCAQGPQNANLDFALPNGLRLGDVIRISKNCTSGSDTNKANFSLLGDPALKLSYPALEVLTDSIHDLAGNSVDTLNALQRVRIYGHIAQGGQLTSNFNGEVSPTLYDKAVNVQTLGNDGGSSYTFSTRKNVLYKGRASVSQGLFSFEFIVPKDISYQQGKGKVFYYGLSDDTDAQGSDDTFFVGGTNDDAPDDELGPSVELYLDSEAFVDGGLTNESPILIVKLFDENGVNTVGNGIGHDITAVLDNNSADPIVLNDYFQLDLDSYQRGELRYQLFNLDEGDHTLRFKVWDIYNNSSVIEVSFKVKNEEDLSLDNVVNYPNPFTTHTEFLFEHNQQACDALDVKVQVFTVSGKLVKTIHRTIDSHITLRDQVTWDGRDDYGQRLGRGVYVYKLQVSTPEGAKKEVFEKLVLL